LITFYTYPGPNGRKVSIMLEEAQLAYQIQKVDIEKGEQFHPEFLRINPNNKIPAILDTDGLQGGTAVFEVGAILIYLAEKSGKFLPTASKQRAETIAWLVWGLTGLGSTLPQLHFFGDRADITPPEVIDRFACEALRLYKILERRLTEHEYIAGEFSIADMPTYASTVGMLTTVRRWKGKELGDTPSIDRWMEAIGIRDGIKRGMTVT
jgi:GSH-dependent disulfide-bond oxidoreductase